MNVEDFIEALKKHQKCDVENCLKFNCSECEFALSMDKVPTDDEILMYFEELKDLRVKLERNSKELEVYKKALELACEDLSTVKRCAIRLCKTDTAICLEYDTCHDKYKLADKYIQKVSEEK